ncbi:hypothetical protein OE88DRAFT_1695777 [Heliocybe sulcata]|uniref:ERCC1-like central domain-containing protein n=1 Tax=Heliocybe sulcata TaxID=5364 RepID=A0A5C3NBQ6_9AGAM|nr:hypothetical protein OE88DRAFT_1695777 [Heliocybe sulcata]
MSSTAARPPVKPPVVQPGTGNNIIVNPCQRLNPILDHVRNVGKEFGDIVSDFQVGRTTGVLFLSLKYHRLHPEYIHTRIEKLGHSFNLRILLLMCDVSEHQEPIRELTKTCLINNITIMVAWFPEEAGAYLSTYKQFEHRPPDMIKERVDKDHLSILRTALTSISKVNKTDVETLRTSIGSFAEIASTPSSRLLSLPGFGQVKVRRMKDAFEKPFRNQATSITQYTTSQPRPSSSTSNQPRASVSQKPSSQGPQSSSSHQAQPPSSAKEKGNGIDKQLRSEDREQSIVWDTDIHVSEFTTPGPDPRPSTTTAPPSSSHSESKSGGKRRPPSPVWDIELDLNESDTEDDLRASKRPREDAPDEEDGGFGAPTRGL